MGYLFEQYVQDIYKYIYNNTNNIYVKSGYQIGNCMKIGFIIVQLLDDFCNNCCLSVYLFWVGFTLMGVMNQFDFRKSNQYHGIYIYLYTQIILYNLYQIDIIYINLDIIYIDMDKQNDFFFDERVGLVKCLCTTCRDYQIALEKKKKKKKKIGRAHV
eukprot:TRINITY_DN1550_c0_g2_i10.p3 TRINITY_DN1550_c0_g2~~TRINITY_DN1550_c0_g2_i10.p3  ORF type:complete len:158 (-),score=4.55 TRINITY_DN1550_c0_g2_i10:74-547(-)